MYYVLSVLCYILLKILYYWNEMEFEGLLLVQTKKVEAADFLDYLPYISTV